LKCKKEKNPMLTQETYKSRWGFHPCDYQTFKKLKFLHKLYHEALRKKAEWERWERKAPWNRVIRHKIRNSQGQVIGFQPPVCRPEPELCPVFNEKVKEVHMRNLDVFADYQNARHPSPLPEEVQPLKLSLEEIDRLYQQVQ